MRSALKRFVQVLLDATNVDADAEYQLEYFRSEPARLRSLLRSAQRCCAWSFVCAECRCFPDAGTDFDGFEQRWILSFDLADQKGGCSISMLYHDAAAGILFLEGDGADDATSVFRSKAWSVRVVNKKNELKHTN